MTNFDRAFQLAIVDVYQNDDGVWSSATSSFTSNVAIGSDPLILYNSAQAAPGTVFEDSLDPSLMLSVHGVDGGAGGVEAWSTVVFFTPLAGDVNSPFTIWFLETNDEGMLPDIATPLPMSQPSLASNIDITSLLPSAYYLTSRMFSSGQGVMIVFAIGVATEDGVRNNDVQIEDGVRNNDVQIEDGVRNNDVQIELVYFVQPGLSPNAEGFVRLIQIVDLRQELPSPYTTPGLGLVTQDPMLPLYSRRGTDPIQFLGFALGGSDVFIQAVYLATLSDGSEAWAMVDAETPMYLSAPTVPDDQDGGGYTNAPLLQNGELLTLLGTDGSSAFLVWMGRPAAYTWNAAGEPDHSYNQQAIYVLVLQLTITTAGNSALITPSAVYDSNSENIFVGRGLQNYPQISSWSSLNSAVQITLDFPASFALPSGPLPTASAVTQVMPIAMDGAVLQYSVISTAPVNQDAAEEPNRDFGISVQTTGSTAQFDDSLFTGQEPCTICSLMLTTSGTYVRVPRQVKRAFRLYRNAKVLLEGSCKHTQRIMVERNFSACVGA